MNHPKQHVPASGADDLYAEAHHWHVNTGGETIHAKRLPGRFRTLKWIASSVWLVFFLGPYLRWGERQAVLFDIPSRQYHFFAETFVPQDFWLLTLVLLFFAFLLAFATAVAGRVWCGYFCFQTVWTDLYTWIEERIDGQPPARRQLEAARWSLAKAGRRALKHGLWIAIAVVTGVSFTAWFTDAYGLWRDLFRLDLHPAAWAAIATFAGFTYLFAGFMREQVCFWLCPYARLQGVMMDRQTIVPAYDEARGEPRRRVRRGLADLAGGDCIDCNQCVAVCPTGIDIREGQQEGCIMCGLCLDACDRVMDKVGRPRGLVRYVSLEELAGAPARPLLRRPRVLVYGGIMALAALGIVIGVAARSPLGLNVIHERQPLYVMQSDGSIQNKYLLKAINKTDTPIELRVRVLGQGGLRLLGADDGLRVPPGEVRALSVFLRLPEQFHTAETLPVTFRVEDAAAPQSRFRETDSVFIGPPPARARR